MVSTGDSTAPAGTETTPRPSSGKSMVKKAPPPPLLALGAPAPQPLLAMLLPLLGEVLLDGQLPKRVLLVPSPASVAGRRCTLACNVHWSHAGKRVVLLGYAGACLAAST